MIRFLSVLEPRQYQKDEIILRDLEEVEEILFVIKGEYAIGYTVNNIEHFALKLHERTVIGDMSIMFRRRSEFMYKALSYIDCQAIRKQQYYDIVEKYHEYGMKIKAKTFNRYKDLIRRPVLEHKRATYEHIFRLHPNERNINFVVDESINDELILLQELNEGGSETVTQVKKVKLIEEGYDKLFNVVNEIYKKHDEALRDICSSIE